MAEKELNLFQFPAIDRVLRRFAGDRVERDGPDASAQRTFERRTK